MPYPYSGTPQSVDLAVQYDPDSSGMPPSLRRALEQAAARMVGGEDRAEVDSGQYAQAQPQPQIQGLSAPPYSMVVQRLLSDPAVAAHLQQAARFQPAAQSQPSENLGPADFGPTPYAPMERMQWDMAHGVHNNQIADPMRAKAAGRHAMAQRLQAGNAGFLQALAQADPLFSRVYPLLIKYLRHLPPQAAQSLAPQVDSNPLLFLELYGHMRQLAQNAVHLEAQPAPGADPRAAVRRTVAGRMHAPSLENPGAMDESAPVGTRQAQLAALKAKMSAQGAGPGDLEKYLELHGVAERMVR